tara:strand:+ start:1094 stop:1801 length:708 start_codon:yes stop_codon:yes gene_type:complete
MIQPLESSDQILAEALGEDGVGIVKQFRNDDPSTYLSNEVQQKNMLIDMLVKPIVDPTLTTKQYSILNQQLPVMGAATVAGAAAGGSKLFKDRAGIRSDKNMVGPLKKGVSKTRAALGPLKGVLGKGLATSLMPAALLPIAAMDLTNQVREGDSTLDIATNPMNYLGPAFSGSLVKEATAFSGPTASSIMRLGISPKVLKTVSRRFGLPGLAISAGISGYEMFDNYRKGKGLFDD